MDINYSIYTISDIPFLQRNYPRTFGFQIPTTRLWLWEVDWWCSIPSHPDSSTIELSCLPSSASQMWGLFWLDNK